MTSQTFILIKRAHTYRSLWAMAGLNQLLHQSHPLREFTASALRSSIKQQIKKVPKVATKILKDGATVNELSRRELGLLRRLDNQLRIVKNDSERFHNNVSNLSDYYRMRHYFTPFNNTACQPQKSSSEVSSLNPRY